MTPGLGYLVVTCLVLAGCGETSGANDMAACVPPSANNAPHACGPMMCAADEYCFFEAFGACPPPDLSRPLDDGGAGGGGPAQCGQYSCAKLPSSCDCSQLCGPNGLPGPTGCLHSVPACQYALTGCWLRNSIITCGDQ